MAPYDMVVIGAGPAGEKGAAQAAYFGKRVCVVERAPRPGGAAINTGTIPSKTLRETALYFSGLRQRGLYGVDYTVKPDITVADFMFRERNVVESEWALIEENLRRHGIDVVHGTARFEDAHTLLAEAPGGGTRRLSGDVMLIATGSRPVRPATIPFDDAVVVDSDSILRLARMPSRLIVVGGGVIGCEYACIFAALGVRVTLLNARERLLTQLDADIGDALRERMMTRLGIDVRLGADVASIAVRDALATVTLADGSALDAECVLYSIGRAGCTEGLGLERAGVALGTRGFIPVDERFRTSVPNIYAAGDVIGFPALASTSMEQARVAVCHAFDLRYKEHVSPVLPYAVYTIPEVSSVGETEDGARAKGLSHAVGRASYRLNPRGQIIGDVDGMIKLVFRPEDLRLLGVSIIGEGAAELIHVGMACLAFGGTIDFFIQSVFNYPTLADAYKYAAYDGLQKARGSGIGSRDSGVALPPA
ncbi:MAG TPA: Si-specific NAD(P)(+) transhydrogenase [Gemmatimonadaceae bacterium]|nr:Si-specific NAD(P)(+) transhydrogenase [Gemmatimonadaceae bacterium]